jgi:hypothetical protein
MTAPVPIGEVLPDVIKGLARAAKLSPKQLAARYEEIHRTGGCRRPVHVIGEALTVHAPTGEILHRYSTEDEPLGRLAIRCGTRRETRCPPCSAVYKADAFHIVYAGLAGGPDTPESVRKHPRVFVTLTAPSFGPVHSRVPVGDLVQRCYPRTKTGGPSCTIRHRADDPLLGHPIDPDTYDYIGAVLWNNHAPDLWARFAVELRRAIARAAGIPQRRLSELLRVTMAKAGEYQRRGLVHFHAVIRMDGPEPDQPIPPPAWATIQRLEDAVRVAARRACVTTPESRSVPAFAVRWGRQLDIRPIAAFGNGQTLSDTAVAAYIAKYATKSAEAAGTIDTPIYCRHCGGAGITHAQGLSLLDVSDHARRMIQVCWRLAEIPELAERNLRKWAHMLGFGGHFLTKSRRYSITFTQIRQTRTAHARADARELAGVPEPDGETVVVVAHWRYAGHGAYDAAKHIGAADPSAGAGPSGVPKQEE